MSTSTAPSTNNRPFFCMGLDTYKVPQDFHTHNRNRLLKALSTILFASSSPKRSSFIFLKGGSNPERNDTDHEPIFRQESYFHYLFGVKEPGFSGMIDVSNGEVTLFMPRLPKEYATFMGKIPLPQDICETYHVENCKYTDEIHVFLSCKLRPSTSSSSSVLFLLEGRNSDSGNMYIAPSFPPVFDVFIDKCTLFPILAECRVIKSKHELELMRHVAELTSEAHVEVMRNCKPGMTEWQLEALFRHYVYFNYGCRNVAYTPICACGPNSSVLHYGHAGAPNERTLLATDLCLMDMVRFKKVKIALL